MFESFNHFIAERHIVRDLFDIAIVAYVIYRAFLVIKGTRAMQMGIGLGVVMLVYIGAKFLHLVTLLNLLSGLLSSIVLVVVVVFQNDIRRALIRVGSRAWFSRGREQQSRVIDEVVGAATELARHRIGAIIAFEQDANLMEFTRSEGISLDSAVSRELLVALFYPESLNKLHDGAVIIRDLKIARAGVFFPMPETKILDASLGSRHRAAIGITEETDAVVVVVSEERGSMSLCFSGNIVPNLDGQSLRQALFSVYGRTPKKTVGSRMAALAASVRSSSERRDKAPTAIPPSSRPVRDSTAVATPLPTAPRVSMASKTPTPAPVKPISGATSKPMKGATSDRTSNYPEATSSPMPLSSRDPLSNKRDGGRKSTAPRSGDKPPESGDRDADLPPESARSDKPRTTFVPVSAGATTTPVSEPSSSKAEDS